MKQPFLLCILLSFTFLLLESNTILPLPFPTLQPTTSSTTTLDPKQLRALQSLNFPTSIDPCSNPPSLKSTALCENGKPFQHLVSLHLADCSNDVFLSFAALKSLSTLRDLSFINCPATIATHFPSDLASNLQSFTCINSLRVLTGDMLSQLQNVVNLTASHVPINASGPSVIIDNLPSLSKLTISHANLEGFMPKSWHSTITQIDLSNNKLKGNIHPSITDLENLVSLDLTANRLTGELPTSIGDLIALRNLSLSSNSLSGSIPESMISMPELEYIDLSSNQFNGTIPKFFNKLKRLKYLSLENNNFHGIMPFNQTFIAKLEVFKIGNNMNLCYDNSSFTPNVSLGIAPCDKNGVPVRPPMKAVPSGGDDEDDEGNDFEDEGGGSEVKTSQKSSEQHGSNKAVLGLAIAVSSIAFLLIFLIFISKRFAS
ncbi:hypothetical protein RND81_06G101600 [Saponaria officinalis]|uniref:Receptor-like protein 51 n=1 Tax=Saponaria officinalis TaxID=3572 RepID=A0AAW1K860_SAPOF